MSNLETSTLAGSALLTNAVGLHARPSVRLTQVAKRFRARIEFALDAAGPWADAKSPVKVMRAKAAKGSTLHFRVSGPDAREALDAMLTLVERHFEEIPAAPGAGTERRYTGRPAAPGVAFGPLFTVPEASAVARVSTGRPESETTALQAAVAGALADLRRLVSAAQGEVADILGFQVAFLEDPVLAERAFAAIAGGAAAHEAWLATLSAEAAAYESSEDEYFRARVADLRDIRDRVQAHLTGSPTNGEIPAGAVVAAVDLPPSRFLAVDWSRGGALVLSAGSPTSHVAMLARARGVPAVVGLGVPLGELTGARALVYATRGQVILDPGPVERAAFELEARALAAERAAAAQVATAQAETKDGTPIRVLVNVASADDLRGLDPAICDGIGLVRTELWFHDRAGLPDEETQYAAYRRIVEWAHGRAVTVRTLDAGGDKPIAGLTLARESNPFLGVRGLRLSFAAPDVFRTQLRALLRAAAHGDFKVMLPMVTLPRELERARAILAEEAAALEAAGVPAGRPGLGIMIEVPAAAITADLFAADFFSIGSNDLVQYVAAAGRDIEAVADLADPTQPAVLRLIRRVVDVAAERGIEVSLCGDAAADPAAIPALLAAGLRTLSVAPALVGRTKLAIAATDLREATGAP